jgi:hypothetical protein
MRFKDIYVTAPRAFSKSFITILAMILQCIFIPGTKRFICAPNKTQAAQIAKEKIVEIYDRWPLLRKEVLGGEISDTPGNFGKDYVTLKFRNGSQFDVVGALDSQRGGRRHGGLIDEVRDHEEGPINEVVLPLMNVSRRLPDNSVNEKEPNQQRIFMTSAGVKTSFAYDLLSTTLLIALSIQIRPLSLDVIIASLFYTIYLIKPISTNCELLLPLAKTHLRANTPQFGLALLKRLGSILIR